MIIQGILAVTDFSFHIDGKANKKEVCLHSAAEFNGLKVQTGLDIQMPDVPTQPLQITGSPAFDKFLKQHYTQVMKTPCDKTVRYIDPATGQVFTQSGNNWIVTQTN
jgi:hypothetical protein